MWKPLHAFNRKLKACILKHSLLEAKWLFDNAIQIDAVSSTIMVTAYASQGRVDYAKAAFDRIREPDVILRNALVSCYFVNGLLVQARHCFESMPKRDVVSFNTLLAAFTVNGQVREAEFVMDRIAARNVVSYNSLLAAYGSAGEPELAEAVFDNMPERNLVSFNSMVAAYASSGYLADRAKFLFDVMPQVGLVTCNALLAGYAEAGRIDDMLELFYSGFMVDKDTLSFNIVVNALTCSGRLDQALTIFHAMSTSRSVVSWTAIIAAYPTGQRSKEVFARMPAWDMVCLNAMMTAYACEDVDTQQCQEFYARMPERNLVTVNVMLRALTQAGELQRAMELFENMAQRNTASCITLLDGLVAHGCVDRARNVFDCMVNVRGPGSWNVVLGGYAQAGDMEAAKSMFDRMPASDGISWAALLLGYAQGGKINLATTLLESMPGGNVVSSTALLRIYAHSGRDAEATEVLRNMQLEGSTAPDLVTFICVLAACSHAGDVKAGRSYFHAMASDYGLVPLQEHYQCIIDLLGRAGHLEEAEDLLESMPFLPGGPEWNSLMGACRSHRDVARAERCAGRAMDLGVGSSEASANACRTRHCKLRRYDMGSPSEIKARGKDDKDQAGLALSFQTSESGRRSRVREEADERARGRGRPFARRSGGDE